MMTTISKIPSNYLKCPTCLKTPNPDKVSAIISDAIVYRDNRPFNPEDPIIVSETEIYCNSHPTNHNNTSHNVNIIVPSTGPSSGQCYTGSKPNWRKGSVFNESDWRKRAVNVKPNR